LATVASPATWEHVRIDFRANGLALKATGKRLVSPGYHAVYPYFNTSESTIPSVSEGELLEITEVELAEKETQPPNRYGQSQLVEKMEEMGIGTKSTRHNVIDKLYARGYAEGDPPRPTELARGVVEAAGEYAELVVSESMTAELEGDMEAIANGEKSLEEVTEESRDMLRRVFGELTESEREIGSYIREKMKDDQSIGDCPECANQLLIRSGGSGFFVGCDGYPSCDFTLPLPNNGDPVILNDECSVHGLKKIKMEAGKQSFVHGCPACESETTNKEEEIVIGACPECSSLGGELAIKRVNSGSRLVGCTRYPDCDYSLPLPRRGDIEVTDVTCEEHDLPELVVHTGDEPWELGCPICNYREYQAEQEAKANRLQSVKGIGEKTAKKLEDAGIATVDEALAA
jgi:DNA topoisomerase-1